MTKEKQKIEEQRPAEGRGLAIGQADGGPTFSIPMTDPYVEPIVGHYARIAAKPVADVNARPFVLRADDPSALACLKSYRQRAYGAGDKIRGALADEAIAKFTPKNNADLKPPK
jgi:hypothetical protein